MKRASHKSHKPSQADWLASIPETWTQVRGRFAMVVNPDVDRVRDLDESAEVSFVPMEAVGEYGGLNVDRVRLLEEIESGYTPFQDGDVVFAKITPCFENGKGALAFGLSNGVAFGTTELHVLRAGHQLDSRFLFYLTISHPFRRLGEAEMYGAGGQKRVPAEFPKDFRLPLPPLDEQRALVRFLNAETARIDTLIAKKRQLIERLQEKRSALISRTVTRGLPPEAAWAAGLKPYPRLKPSGIEWLGEVPAHWSIAAYKRVCTRVDVGIAEAATHAYCSNGVPIIRSTNVKPNFLDVRDLLRIEPWFAEKNRSKMLRAGDLLTVRTGCPGTTAVVPQELDGSQCFTLVLSSPDPKEAHGPFFAYVLNSHPGQCYFEREGWELLRPISACQSCSSC